MPTLTARKSTPTFSEAVDIAHLTHLGEHPAMQPLFERRTALRKRLAAIREAHTAHRRRVYELRNVTDDFSAIAARKEAERRITDLEDEGGAAEAELRQLQATIETTEAAVKAELRPILAAAGVPVLTALVATLAQLAQVASDYETYSTRYQNILGDSALPTFGFNYLPACRTHAQETLTRLQQLAAPQG
jgi:hypothetical protein